MCTGEAVRPGGTLRAYRALLGAQARSQTAYRASFLLDLLGNLGATVFDVVTVLVIYGVTRELGGFTLRETLVMVGLSASAFAVADLLVGNIERLPAHVRTGLFDAVLLRPLGALPQLLLMNLPLRKVSRGVFGVAVLVVALGSAGIDWTPARVALAVVAPLAGVVFFGSLFVATATVSFWWVDSGELANSVTYGGRDFTSYPVTVFEGWFRAAFAYGLGFAFVSYQPALALLGRADPLGLPSWAGWTAPVVALVAAVVAAAAWRTGIRHYRSTGS
ncbi:ABC transporter permease [Micromonospora rifamycinica]|uniref:ABC-2 type transport system permease protein n=1 Tax=Micromonospora rifamycinica TaxID=291594 RepID=A0A125Q0S9_9ACTN|nr:ABC-2 family transporter protein [Micromonospora rifamycinica]KWV29987.1 ABC transporter permease [Micromonospora rifamycinica]SCG80961.1 ABC-2 type transport system permease protein [Micromonospora rifamycinica]